MRTCQTSEKGPIRDHFVAIVAAMAATWGMVAVTQSGRGIEVRGVVVNGIDGRPVEGVRVTLVQRVLGGQNILNEQAVTDDNGAFLLRAPSAGEFSIEASKRPMSFGAYGRGRMSSSETKGWFAVSGRTTGIVIQLWDPPQVAGAVLDENDQPLARVQVHAIQFVTLGGRQVLRAQVWANTGVDGRYQLQVLSPGAYVLAALPPLSVAGPTRRVQYHPGVTVASAASPVELARSQTAEGIDFHVRHEAGFTISGTVELPTGIPGPNSLELFEVLDGLSSDLVVARVPLPPTGTFSFPPVAAGSYEIRFVRYPEPERGSIPDGALRYNDQRLRRERLADVADGPTWWTAERIDLVDKNVVMLLRLRHGVRVAGRVVFEGPGAKPEPASLPTVAIYLRSLDHRFFRPYPVASAREDGRFRTVQVPAGRYVLGVVNSYDGYQLASAKIGAKEVSGVGIEVNQDISDAVLTFSSRPTAIAGRVAGGEGQERFVLIWPEDEALWTGSGTQLGRIHHVLTSDGGYRVAVFPGTYRVVALDGAPPADWESPRMLRSVLPVSERVIVAAGESVTHNTRVARRR